VHRSSGACVARTCIVVTLLALAAPVSLSSAGSTPSTTTTSAKQQVNAKNPKTTPVKIGGLARGTAIPKDDVLASREATVTRGKDSGKSTNVVTLTCPGDRTVSAVTDSKDQGKPFPFTFKSSSTYGKPTAKLTPTAYDLKGGKSRKGTLYALCIGHA
jgi:hypothetical protein